MTNKGADIMQVKIITTGLEHVQYAERVCKLVSDAAKEENTVLALRSKEYITEKISSGKAVIAINNFKIAGFCYIETWEDKKFVTNSGLVVDAKFRKSGLAKEIKKAAFELSRKNFLTPKFSD